MGNMVLGEVAKISVLNIAGSFKIDERCSSSKISLPRGILDIR